MNSQKHNITESWFHVFFHNLKDKIVNPLFSVIHIDEEALYHYVLDHLLNIYGVIIKDVANKCYINSRSLDDINNDEHLEGGIYIVKYDNDDRMGFDLYEKVTDTVDNGWIRSNIKTNSKMVFVGRFSTLNTREKIDDLYIDMYKFVIEYVDTFYGLHSKELSRKYYEDDLSIDDIMNNAEIPEGIYISKEDDVYHIYQKAYNNINKGWIRNNIVKIGKMEKIVTFQKNNDTVQALKLYISKVDECVNNIMEQSNKLTELIRNSEEIQEFIDDNKIKDISEEIKVLEQEDVTLEAVVVEADVPEPIITEVVAAQVVVPEVVVAQEVVAPEVVAPEVVAPEVVAPEVTQLVAAQVVAPEVTQLVAAQVVAPEVTQLVVQEPIVPEVLVQDIQDVILDKTCKRRKRNRSFNDDTCTKKMRNSMHDDDHKEISNNDIKLLNGNDLEFKMMSDTDFIKRLVGLLDPCRVSNYYDIVTIAGILHKLDSGLFSTFRDFVDKSKRYTAKLDQICEKMWNSKNDDLYDRNMMLLTLRVWASKDNPELYDQLIHEFIFGCINHTLLDNNVNGYTLYTLCVERLYCHQIRTSDHNKGVWYRYDVMSSRWNIIDPKTVLKFVVDDIIDKLIKLYDLRDIITTNEKMTDMISYLSRNENDLPFLAFMINKIYDPYFANLLDANPYLIGFTNGVYDLKYNFFRSTIPSDMISIITRYDYVEYSDDDEYIKEMSAWLANIVGDCDIRNYFLTYLASRLDGTQTECDYWYGENEAILNKFLLLDELVCMAFGEYYDIVDLSKGEDKYLIDKLNKRLLTVHYFNKSKINMNNLKVNMRKYSLLFIGNIVVDTETIKKMNITPIDYINFIDDRDKYDLEKGEITEEIRMNINSSYQDEEIIYLMESVREKFNVWKSAFMWYLIKKYYLIYNRDGCKLTQPQKLIESSIKCINCYTSVQNFIDKYIMITNNDSHIVNISYAYNIFKNYDKDNVTKKEFVEYLIKRQFVICDDRIYGIMIC